MKRPRCYQLVLTLQLVLSLQLPLQQQQLLLVLHFTTVHSDVEPKLCSYDLQLYT